MAFMEKNIYLPPFVADAIVDCEAPQGDNRLRNKKSERIDFANPLTFFLSVRFVTLRSTNNRRLLSATKGKTVAPQREPQQKT